MKANSLEELVTNSNIAGELRNYTDWHTRLVKFAQLVADWQKEQILKDAVEAEVSAVILRENRDEVHYAITYPEGKGPHSITDKVRIVVLKAEEE